MAEGVWLRFQGSGSRPECRVQGLGFRVRIWGSGVRFQGSAIMAFRVQSSGSRLECRVSGSKFRGWG